MMMMVDAEALLVAAYNADPNLTAETLTASADIPRQRPRRFITVERVGGETDLRRDHPMIAVQVWAESRYQAGRLARLVAERTQALHGHPQVGRVNIASTYNFPDPASRQARYQITVSLVTVGG